MTKYILAGGADRKFEHYAKRLNAEVHKTLLSSIRVLSCFFSEPEDLWEGKFADRQGWFMMAFGDDVELKLANHLHFEEQVKYADVIYLHGGETERLAEKLSDFPDIEKMFVNKIVIGSSAGAIWLSDKAWTCDARTVVSGSGLTRFNTIVHYESDEYGKDDPRGPIDWEKAKEELRRAVGPGKEVTPLPEGVFVVVEQ